MADKRHTMRVVARANEITGAAATRARIHAKTLRALSSVLAEELEEVHGGKFRVEISHEARFILIRPEDSQLSKIAKSSLRVAV